MTNTGLLDGLVRCGYHQCPMIIIDDKYRCAIQYANDALGKQCIANVVPGSETEPTWLEFDNGRSLPLVCSCCGEPLQIADVELFRQEVIGLHLAAVGYVPPEDEYAEAFEFVFAPPDMLDDLPDELVGPLPEGLQALAVHVDSVQGIL